MCRDSSIFLLSAVCGRLCNDQRQDIYGCLDYGERLCSQTSKFEFSLKYRCRLQLGRTADLLYKQGNSHGRTVAARLVYGNHHQIWPVYSDLSLQWKQVCLIGGNLRLAFATF